LKRGSPGWKATGALLLIAIPSGVSLDTGIILRAHHGHASIPKSGSSEKRRPCHGTGRILRLYDQLMLDDNM
jgi:hypothetical protein